MALFSRHPTEKSFAAVEVEPASTEVRLLSAVDFETCGPSCAEDDELVHIPGTGRVAVVPSDAVEALARRRGPAPTAEWARRLRQAMPSRSRSAVSDLLADLREQGLLVPADRVLPPASATADRRGRIDVLGIPTRDRPALFERALYTYLEACAARERSPELVVCDGSAEPAAARNRSATHNLTGRRGVAARYFGLAEVDAAIVQLAQRGFDPALLRFALLPGDGRWAPGASRNLLLLSAAGRLLFSADDDTVCRPVAPARTRELAFSSEPDPTLFSFHADLDSALASLPVDVPDFLGAHESMLGRHAHHIAPARADLSRARPALIRRLARGRGRVAVTMNGIAGDSGMDSTVPFVAGMSAESRERLDADQASYDLALTGRCVARLVPGPVISDARHGVGAFLGLDCRELLPPFFPEFRGQDAAFMATLAAIDPSALAGHLPFAMVHDPGPVQGYRPAAEAATTLRFADVFALLASQHAATLGETGDRPTRLASLAAHLRALGASSTTDFIDAVWPAVLRHKSSLLEFLESTLLDQRPSAPRTGDLEDMRDALAAALADPDQLQIEELRTTADPWVECRTRIDQYGRLLDCWPDLLAAFGQLEA